MQRLGTPAHTAERAWGIARHYPGSLFGGFRQRSLFQNLETFCLFVGYPRSGHSLVGSLLDAHPEIILAHEQHILRYVRSGFGKLQIYHLLLANSRRSSRLQHGAALYSYRVPDQWQGKFTRLRVIGDKGAWGATLALRQRPFLLDRLRQRTGLAVKIVHVVRNPFDTISRMAERERVGLEAAADHYFRLCETVESLRSLAPDHTFLDVEHEALIAAPERQLAMLCAFLGVKTTDDYLHDCAAILFRSPHKSRQEVPWRPDLVRHVQSEVERFPALAHYRFDA